jgi:ATP-dependent protease ClpP protease subunit
MELNFTKIVGLDKRKCEMMLYGELGEGINGHDFARELNWLGQNYDEIKIRINSNGGSISQGLSIVAEMITSPAKIIAQVDGIAASMAAVILAAADKVIINDYAKVMIHSPFYVDENGDKVKTLSAKDQKSLGMLKDTLVSLLTKRGIATDEVNRMMKTDTWFTADEALTAKLVDEVCSTGRKKDLAALSPLQLVAKLTDELNTNNPVKMKKVIAKLGLAEDATEDQVVEAIAKLAPTSTPVDLNEKLIDKLLVVGKKTGIVTDKTEKAMRALAKADTEAFCELIDEEKLGSKEQTPKTPQARMSDLVAQAKASTSSASTSSATERDFGWYEKNDPKALARMEVQEPEKFAKLLAADQAQYE